MPQLPYSKWYWRDWLADPRLRLCSLSARGLWIDMLALAGVSEKRGFVIVNGTPVNAAVLSQVLSVPELEVATALAELEEHGVFSRDRKGLIYSRRMKRDERKRATNTKNGKLGGNPTLSKEQPIPSWDKASVEDHTQYHTHSQNPEREDDSDGRARGVRDRLEEMLGRNPNIVNWSRLDVWLAAGCDPDRDILPAVAGVLARKPPGWCPSTLSYFDNPVAQAKADRLKPMPEATNEPQFSNRRAKTNGDSFIAGAMRAGSRGD